MKTGKKIKSVMIEGGPGDEKKKKKKKGNVRIVPGMSVEDRKGGSGSGSGSSGRLKWQRIKKSDKPLSDWEIKKAEEKAQKKKEKEGKKSFRGNKLKLFFRKLKGKMTNPELKDQKCKPSGGTKNCPKSYLGGKN